MSYNKQQEIREQMKISGPVFGGNSALSNLASRDQNTEYSLVANQQADASRKAEEYAAIGLLQEAAEAAAQVQDSAMLTRIQGMVGVGSPLSAAVTQLKDRITLAATR
eukprot:jgi/Astpho2/7022/Aster-x0748